MQVQSLRTFIGSRDYDASRAFYTDLGFVGHTISPVMSLFEREGNIFYLQDYYVKDWLGNTMLLIEVNSASACFELFSNLGLEAKYPGVKVHEVVREEWADVCRVHGPAGELLHFAQFREGVK